MNSMGLKVSGLLLLLLIAVLVTLKPGSNLEFKSIQGSASAPASSDHFPANSSSTEPVCLAADSATRPPWECYQISVGQGPEQYRRYHVRHSDGTDHRVLSFQQNGQEWIRFVPDRTGSWCIYPEPGPGGAALNCLTITAPRPDYAKGFVNTHELPHSQQQFWQRTATAERFVPQFVMFDQADIDAGIRNLIEGHGFTGFHIPNLREFMSDPAYFESLITRTYRAGGVTYFWLWGDETRKQTPATFGIDVDQLYNEICARLMPLPGWMVGYGFDNFEWASAAELKQWHQRWRTCSSYPHLMGARGYKNQYKPIWSGLDFAAWEWHRPTLKDYRDHIKHAQNKPALSGDRFRIRSPSKYPEKDYTETMTYRGLWESLFAGGVGNIWGKQDRDGTYSQNYELKSRLKLHAEFVSAYLKPESEAVAMPGYAGCLRSSQALVCLAWNTNSAALPVEAPAQVSTNLEQAFGINIQQSLDPVPVTLSSDNQHTLVLPTLSDWVIIFPTP